MRRFSSKLLPSQLVRCFSPSSTLFAGPVRAQFVAQWTRTASTSKMFCMQCEQTQDNKGCTTVGVCGKSPEVAGAQDVLVHVIKGVSQYANRLRKLGVTNAKADELVCEALFATLTNVNFSMDRIQELVQQMVELREELRAEYERTCTSPEKLNNEYSTFVPAKDVAAFAQQAADLGVLARKAKTDADIFSLQELITYGIKGVAAYAAHARAVNETDSAIAGYIYDAFDYISSDDQNIDSSLAMALRCGEANFRAMERLNVGHTTLFGAPTPARVSLKPVEGKCILVSGHDLHDLHALLEQTEGTGINVYTHGEMLPAHGYPKLRQFPHLKGNYGSAWQLQKMDFAGFPGPILMTTNCLVEPRKSYQDRIYTTNAVGFDNVKHVTGRDYSTIIRQAQEECEGYTAEDVEDAKDGYTMTGFGHEAVIGIADKIVDLVQKGTIKKFFLVGGCDGSEGERSYYTKLALTAPKESVVLTLGCAKYRFNRHMERFGNIEGTELPRMLDVGQCNDAYSAVRIAGALAEAFKTDVNSLPLSIVLSWFEQKAVAVLLTLLHLNIKNIRVGPNLPAFLSPNVLDVLVTKFGLTPISNHDAEGDLKKMLA